MTAALPGVAFGTVPAAGAAPAPSAAPTPPPSAAPAPAPSSPAPPPPSPPPAAATPYAPPPAAPPPGAQPAPYPYAPPPGYYYPPPAYPPAAPPAYFTAQRLALLGAELTNLRFRYDEITFGGPVALIVSGAVVGVVGLAIIPENTYCSYNDPYYDDCQSRQDQATLGVLMFAAGAAGVTIGIIQSIIRGSKRRHLARQIQLRESEAAALRGLQPRWGVAPLRHGGGLTLALDF